MHSPPRQLILPEVVRARGAVTVQQIADKLAVTLKTVRGASCALRDPDALEVKMAPL